jgi:ABC-type transport system substrate-binding protein
MLRLAALVGGSTGVAMFLAACGATASPSPSGAASPSEAAATGAAPSAAAPSAEASASAATAKSGGTLRVAQGADITQLDPFLSNITTENGILFNIYETLGYFDDTTLLVKPRLAESWAWADDDKSVTFKLRQGVKFHAGSSMTAADVKYSFDRMADPKTGSQFATLISDMTSVDIVDDSTVKFNTNGYSNKLIAALPKVPIIPKDSGGTIAKTPNGTGPFKFVEWVVNNHVKIEKNASYWQPGLPYLDAIVFQPITDEATRVSALQSGQADLLYNIALSDVAQFKTDPSKYQVILAPPVDQPYDAYINTKKPPFDKLEARQALCYMIDRKGFVDGFLAGLGDTAYSPIAKTHWAFDPSLVGKYEYDLTKAADLLTQAGYPGGKGFNVVMVIPTGFPEHKEISTLVQSAIQQLGGTASIQEDDVNTWVDKLNKHQFDLGFDTDIDHAGDPALLFGLTYLWHPDSKINLSQFTDDMAPGYSDLIAQASVEKDQTKRVAMYAQIQEKFMDLAVGPMVCFRNIPHAMTPAVNGFVPAIQFRQSYANTWMNS